MFLAIVRYVPQWFPGAEFRRKARSWASAVQNVPDMAYKQYQKSVVRDQQSITTTE